MIKVASNFYRGWGSDSINQTEAILGVLDPADRNLVKGNRGSLVDSRIII